MLGESVHLLWNVYNAAMQRSVKKIADRRVHFRSRRKRLLGMKNIDGMSDQFLLMMSLPIGNGRLPSATRVLIRSSCSLRFGHVCGQGCDAESADVEISWC